MLWLLCTYSVWQLPIAGCSGDMLGMLWWCQRTLVWLYRKPFLDLPQTLDSEIADAKELVSSIDVDNFLYRRQPLPMEKAQRSRGKLDERVNAFVYSFVSVESLYSIFNIVTRHSKRTTDGSIGLACVPSRDDFLIPFAASLTFLRYLIAQIRHGCDSPKALQPKLDNLKKIIIIIS